MNEAPYREPPPLTRSEFEVLVERVKALEASPPKPPKPASSPFIFRHWHIVLLGFGTTIVTTLFAGWIYDHIHASGMCVGLMCAMGLIWLMGLGFTFAALVTLGGSLSLISPWFKEKE